jgi:hypothetical protein
MQDGHRRATVGAYLCFAILLLALLMLSAGNHFHSGAP